LRTHPGTSAPQALAILVAMYFRCASPVDPECLQGLGAIRTCLRIKRTASNPTRVFGKGIASQIRNPGARKTATLRNLQAVRCRASALGARYPNSLLASRFCAVLPVPACGKMARVREPSRATGFLCAEARIVFSLTPWGCGDVAARRFADRPALATISNSDDRLVAPYTRALNSGHSL